MAAVQVISSIHPRPIYDPRPSLKTKLCQESFHIPNLRALYKDWPDAVNTNYPQLKMVLEARIDKYARQPMNKVSLLGHLLIELALPSVSTLLRKRLSWSTVTMPLWRPCRGLAQRPRDCRHVPFGYCGFLPGTTRSISPPQNSLATSKRPTNSGRCLFTTLGTVRECRLRTHTSSGSTSTRRRPNSSVVWMWLVPICRRCTTRVYLLITIPQTLVLPEVDTIFSDQIMCFVNEIGYYMDSQQRDQGRKLTGKVPTVDEYWETRLGTSAVTCCLALYEYDRLHLSVSLFCYLVADRSYRQIRRWIWR